MPARPYFLPRFAWTLTLALLAMFMHVEAGRAHASLNIAVPADGAVLKEAPQSFSLTFSEPASPLALRLVKPDGSAVPLDRFSLKDRTVEIETPDEIGRGTHVLTWRVVSEDGHPVGGSVVFSIGELSAQPPAVDDDTDWVVRGWLWLGKVALYSGLFIGVGGAFAIRVLMPGVSSGRRIIASALIIGAAGAIISVGFQGLDALGAAADRLGEAIVWSTGIGTSYGRTVFVALAAFGLAGAALGPSGVAARFAALLAWVLASVAPSLSGHASAATPEWLMRPAVLLHAAAIGVWIGALAPLGLALHRKQPGAVPALRRFSAVVPAILALLVLAGIVLAAVQVEKPAALFDTAYGQVFLAKLALLIGLFLIAAGNRLFLTRRTEAGDTQSTRRLARSIAAETVVIMLIFGAAAAWRFTPPPRALAAAAAVPATTHIHTEKAMADVTVTPGRAGPVNISAIVMTGDFGPLDAKDVTFVFSRPDAGIEPFRWRAKKPGDGTWRADDVVLPLPGQWTVQVEVLISDFDIARLEGLISIRP